MSKQRILGTVAAACILLAGSAYLTFGKSALAPSLIICALAVLVMGGASAAEAKRSGISGFAAYIPAICYGILAAAIIAAIIYLLIN